MTTVVLDLEADNLLPFATKIWCVSVLDTTTDNVVTYRTKEDLLAASSDWTTLIGHNIVAYDLYALWLLWGIHFTIGPDSFNERPIKIVDTLVLSRYLWPDRTWLHSLENWGLHLGFEKGSHTDFTQYSEEMRRYCEQDTRVCWEVYKYLQKEVAQ